MNKLKRLLSFRPAPNRMTLGAFLLCLAPVLIGLIVTLHSEKGAYAATGCLLTLISYITTKVGVAVHYEHKYEKPTLEIQN